MEERRRSERKARSAGGSTEGGKPKAEDVGEASRVTHDVKGKGKGVESTEAEADDPSGETEANDTGVGTEVTRGERDYQPLGPLVVLACRHAYHQMCLDALQAQQDSNGEGRRRPDEYSREREYRCPIDG